MTSTSLIFSFGQTVLDSSVKKKAAPKPPKVKEPEEVQVIEDYEGECEKCQNTKPQKACSICGE